MKSLAASVVTLALLAPAAAHAGTYVGVGIGTGASTDGGLSIFDSTGQHSGRLVLGDKFGLISVEGGLGYFGLQHAGNDWNATSLGAAAKLSLPILPLFTGYVRLGVEETKLSAAGTTDRSASGWTGGLGLQYDLEKLSLWADVSKHTLNFDDSNMDGAATMVTVGVSVGI